MTWLLAFQTHVQTRRLLLGASALICSAGHSSQAIEVGHLQYYLPNYLPGNLAHARGSSPLALVLLLVLVGYRYLHSIDT